MNSTYVGSSARESPQLNQTVYEETYGTNVRDETHVTDEAHESARTLVARRTGRTTRLSRRSERNALRIFWRSQRLAVDTGDGKVQVYDTGDHCISGVQQHQSSSGRKVTFTSQQGKVDLATLKPA